MMHTYVYAFVYVIQYMYVWYK